MRELFEQDSDLEETYPLHGDQIDLEPLARDAVLLELPLTPLCAEDCQGLCSTCGASRNEGDCEHDGRLREGDPRGVQAHATECGEQPDPGHGGRQDEWQLDERQQHVAAPEPLCREQVRRRRAKQHDQSLRDQAGPDRDDERVARDRVAELADERRRRDLQEDRQHGQDEERERDGCREPEEQPHGRPNPAARSVVRPRLERTSRMNAVASVRCFVVVGMHIWY